MRYPIEPVAKPRQTQSDKWKKRPCVMRYRYFADLCRSYKMVLPDYGAKITFILPMPKSWSKKRQVTMDNKPHQQRPDISNLLKAVEDAIHAEDSHIWHYSQIRKIWGFKGYIEIE